VATQSPDRFALDVIGHKHVEAKPLIDASQLDHEASQFRLCGYGQFIEQYSEPALDEHSMVCGSGCGAQCLSLTLPSS